MSDGASSVVYYTLTYIIVTLIGAIRCDNAESPIGCRSNNKMCYRLCDTTRDRRPGSPAASLYKYIICARVCYSIAIGLAVARQSEYGEVGMAPSMFIKVSGPGARVPSGFRLRFTSAPAVQRFTHHYKHKYTLHTLWCSLGSLELLGPFATVAPPSGRQGRLPMAHWHPSQRAVPPLVSE